MLHLVQLTVDMREQFFSMVNDFRSAGEERYSEALKDGFDYEEYVISLEKESQGQNIPEGRVPMTTFWMIDDNKVIYGSSRIRHYLNPWLEKEGGHIGYAIPPSMRRNGYGTLLLKLMLGKARELGLSNVLVTCDSDNIGSARIIQKNNGVFENEVMSDTSGKLVSRYYIAI